MTRFKPPVTKKSRHPDDNRLYDTKHTFHRSGKWFGRRIENWERVELTFYHDDGGELYLAIGEPDGSASVSLDAVAARRVAKLLMDYADQLGKRKKAA